MEIFKLVWEMRQGGVQGRYTYPNGKNISVILHSGSYGREDGLWEIMCDCSECKSQQDDVVGWLTLEQVNQHMERLSK